MVHSVLYFFCGDFQVNTVCDLQRARREVKHAVFSPLTANIYLPALPALSVAFGKSTELINLTVSLPIVDCGG